MTGVPVLPSPGFTAAFALSAILTVAVRDPPRLWSLAQALPGRASPMPWIVLAMLALASGLFAVLDPLQFLAASGDGIADPAASTLLLGP